MVPLREELEIVKSYLMIQKERFADRFTIEYNFSDDAYDCLIPKMVIQPLVENAIVHGLEKSLKPGSILIGAGRNPQHGYLAIWIFDTGVGMPPENYRSCAIPLRLPFMTKPEMLLLIWQKWMRRITTASEF